MQMSLNHLRIWFPSAEGLGPSCVRATSVLGFNDCTIVRFVCVCMRVCAHVCVCVCVYLVFVGLCVLVGLSGVAIRSRRRRGRSPWWQRTRHNPLLPLVLYRRLKSYTYTHTLLCAACSPMYFRPPKMASPNQRNYSLSLSSPALWARLHPPPLLLPQT